MERVDAGSEMKARLRADLLGAMKDRNQLDARVIRSLVAAIDNAEAPALPGDRGSAVSHAFATRSAEVERLWLSWPQVREILAAEFQERERAAAGFDGLGRQDHAESLRAEARVIQRYLALET